MSVSAPVRPAENGQSNLEEYRRLIAYFAGAPVGKRDPTAKPGPDFHFEDFYFYDRDGDPDVSQARVFRERLDARIPEQLRRPHAKAELWVEQRSHRIVVYYMPAAAPAGA